jgi:flagellar export protein FliJ
VNRRERRLKVLADHRQKQLEEQIRSLNEYQRALALAEERRTECRRTLAEAISTRNEAATHGISSDRWAEVNQWLLGMRNNWERVLEEYRAAEQQVLEGRERVMEARTALKQVEKLMDQERQQQALAEKREERRAGDEHTAGAITRKHNQ